jgi:hypothetical protein
MGRTALYSSSPYMQASLQALVQNGSSVLEGLAAAAWEDGVPPRTTPPPLAGTGTGTGTGISSWLGGRAPDASSPLPAWALDTSPALVEGSDQVTDGGAAPMLQQVAKSSPTAAAAAPSAHGGGRGRGSRLAATAPQSPSSHAAADAARSRVVRGSQSPQPPTSPSRSTAGGAYQSPRSPGSRGGTGGRAISGVAEAVRRARLLLADATPHTPADVPFEEAVRCNRPCPLTL